MRDVRHGDDVVVEQCANDSCSWYRKIMTLKALGARSMVG